MYNTDEESAELEFRGKIVNWQGKRVAVLNFTDCTDQNREARWSIKSLHMRQLENLVTNTLLTTMDDVALNVACLLSVMPKNTTEQKEAGLELSKSLSVLYSSCYIVRNYARVSLGNIPKTSYMPVKYRSIVQKIVKQMKTIMKNRNLDVRLDFSTSLPLTIHIDKQLFKQVISNLVKYAI
jgi:signal transduction histidine kinase